MVQLEITSVPWRVPVVRRDFKLFRSSKLDSIEGGRDTVEGEWDILFIGRWKKSRWCVCLDDSLLAFWDSRVK